MPKLPAGNSQTRCCDRLGIWIKSRRLIPDQPQNPAPESRHAKPPVLSDGCVGAMAQPLKAEKARKAAKASESLVNMDIP